MKPESQMTNYLTDEAKRIIADETKWSKKYMMDSCILCGEKFKEDYVPLHLWKNGGKESMSFHMKCAFGDNVSDEEDYGENDD